MKLDKDSMLLTPVIIGRITAKNRIFMAPLTRLRADSNGVPKSFVIDYYKQRASAGLIIAEATDISGTANGAYLNAPGIWSEEQIVQWRKVTDAVHNEGGFMFQQIWHVGRLGHSLNNAGRQPIGPSPIAAEDITVHTPEGKKPVEVPRELSIPEIKDIISDFVKAAKNSIAAGFDGIEIHAANGYLINQFISNTANKRTDEYGGSPENRARLAVEVTKAIVDAIGAERVGIRLSPENHVNGNIETDTWEVYEAILKQIEPLNIAYVHELLPPEHEFIKKFRETTTSKILLNTGFTVGTDYAVSEKLVEDKLIDAIVIGRDFISNPDLIARLENGYPLADSDPSTHYGDGPEGYSDYPIYEAVNA